MSRAATVPAGGSALALALALALLRPAAAAAATADEHGPRNAVSVHLAAPLSAGLAVDYERFAVRPRWSFAVTAGLRLGASGDYSSLTLAAGGEARYWLYGRAPFFCLAAGRAMIGPYVGARLDLSRTSLRDERDDRGLGASYAIATSLLFGYRFHVRRAELTPSLGLVTRRDLGGGLASWSKGTLTFGLTAGWMF